MTPKQLIVAIRDFLKAMTWTGTANKVLGENVRVAYEIPAEQIFQHQSPFCFVIEQGSSAFANHPDLHDQAILLVLFVENDNDGFGEGVMLGANRTPDTSKGVGVLDLEQEIIKQITTAPQFSGASITLVQKSRVKTGRAQNNQPSAYRQLQFSALVSLDDTVPAKPSVDDILRAAGNLYWNPGNINGGDYGDHLGYFPAGLSVDAGYDIDFYGSEADGSFVERVLYKGNQVTAIADFISYNANVLKIAFPGAHTGADFIRIASGAKTGDFFDVTQRGQLLFVTLDENFIVTLPRCVPHVTKNFNFNRAQETTFSVSFTSVASSNELGLYVGPRANF